MFRRRSRRSFEAAALITAIAPAVLCCGMHAAGRYADVNGIRMYYEIHGSGPPLLLIHGGAGNGMQFEKQLPDLSGLYRCIVPDCCAQGRTSDRPGPLSYHAMAEDMIALMDRLHLDRADIIGWSDGGNIGLDMAMHHPERVDHLITFGANFQPDGLSEEDVRWNSTATADSFGVGMREGWQKLNPEPEHFEEAMEKIIAMWRTQPWWTHADLATIRAKTLICAGERDLIRPEHTAELAGAIPGAKMWLVPGASHSAMFERWDLVRPRLLEFLSH